MNSISIYEPFCVFPISLVMMNVKRVCETCLENFQILANHDDIYVNPLQILQVCSSG